ncbi:TonB-dependent receptor [Halosquirtibacter xylanolyticus]|uniref:TonB-dependent receptor plug domain-containing protein n=1 Tax=Halosquirtibacter xylanolyticus TaxID=3374599 RepID=UPI003749275B|nr:TonB-dependent receptor [Prolixibacteraceae bacterium]
MKRLFCHLILFLLLCPFVVLSQNNIAQDTLQLNSVTITQKGKSKYVAGKSITRISSKDIHLSNVDNFGEMIIQKSAIYSQQQGRGGAMYLSIRGTGKNHTEAIWNGIPLNSPMYGTVDFSLIPTNVVDQASIYYGGSATGISNSNIGGTIELKTFPNLSDSFSGNIKASIGSFHTYNSDGNISYKLLPKLTANTRTFFSKSLNDFTFTNTSKVEPNEEGTAWVNPKETNDQGDWLTYGLLQEFFYQVNDHSRISAHYWGQDNDRSIPMASTNESSNDARENRSNTHSHRGSLRFFTNSLGWQWNLTSALSYEYNRFRFKNSDANAYSNDDISKSTNSYNRLNGYKDISNKLSLQVDLQYNYLSINTDQQIDNKPQEYTRIQKDVSAKMAYQFSTRISSSLSLQNQWNGTDYSGLIPFVGINILALDNQILEFSASVNRSYNFPTLNDQYAVPGGNPNLKQEDGWGYNVGLTNKSQIGAFSFDTYIEYYQSKINDWIAWEPTEYGYWTPMNKKEVLLYGVNIIHTSTWEANDKTTISGTLNYCYSKTLNHSIDNNMDQDTYNKQLPYTPLHTLSYDMSANYKQWSSQISWIWNSMQYSTTNNVVTEGYGVIDGYNVANIDISYHQTLKQKQQLTYTLSVYNLTNQTYESVVGLTMPGINFLFSINYQF